MKKMIHITSSMVIMILLITLMGTQVFAKENRRAALLPKIQIVTQPKGEYTKDDKISFTVWNPNYIYNVEYRVILYNGTTKKTTNLWNTPSTGYYYRGWQPAGTYKLTIQWSSSQLEPGAYSMTVLVRKKNTSSKYDSYVDTKSFWIINNTNIFTPNGTEKRVENINAQYTYDYSYKPTLTKDYFATPIGMTSKNPYPNTNFSQYYKTINDNIMYLSKIENLPHIYTNDNKDYVMLLGSSSMERDVKLRLEELDNSGVFDGKPHNFEVYLYEVYYDSVKKEYFVANEIHTELLGATTKKVSNSTGRIPHYVAVPVQIADF